IKVRVRQRILKSEAADLFGKAGRWKLESVDHDWNDIAPRFQRVCDLELEPGLVPIVPIQRAGRENDQEVWSALDPLEKPLVKWTGLEVLHVHETAKAFCFQGPSEQLRHLVPAYLAPMGSVVRNEHDVGRIPPDDPIEYGIAR